MTAISQPDQPEKVYALTGDDVGYYIFAQIRPRTNRSEYGEAVQCFYEKLFRRKMWKQTGSGQIFITFLFTAIPETKRCMEFDAKRPADTCDLKVGPGKDAGLLALRCNRGRQ